MTSSPPLLDTDHPEASPPSPRDCAGSSTQRSSTTSYCSQDRARLKTRARVMLLLTTRRAIARTAMSMAQGSACVDSSVRTARRPAPRLVSRPCCRARTPTAAPAGACSTLRPTSVDISVDIQSDRSRPWPSASRGRAPARGSVFEGCATRETCPRAVPSPERGESPRPSRESTAVVLELVT